MQIDPLKYSILGDDTKRALGFMLETLEDAKDQAVVDVTVKHIFKTMASELDPNLLMSSIKDYRRIGASPMIAEEGIHVMRSYVAHKIYEKRRKLRGYYSDAAMLLEEQGVVCIPNYFPESIHNQIIEELKPFELATSKNDNNIISRLQQDLMIKRVVCANLHMNPLYGVLMDCLAYPYTGRDNHEPTQLYLNNTFVQKLHNKKGDGDVQKVLHQDTFFPALKFWYFPKEVKSEDGPFVYAVGSNKLTASRAKYIYDQSYAIACQKDTGFTKDHEEGSLRVNESDLAAMGYKESKFPVAANTLVIANVFGFHRRSEVEAEGFRDSIHGSIRVAKPFNLSGF